MGNLFGVKKPTPQPVTPMPDPDGPEAQAARMAELLSLRQRSGRASTILSDSNRNYTATRLGAN